MTSEDTESIAKVAGKEAALQTLIALGIDVANPTETQADFIYLRRWRKLIETITSASFSPASSPSAASWRPWSMRGSGSPYDEPERFGSRTAAASAEPRRWLRSLQFISSDLVSARVLAAGLGRNVVGPA
jgi:hypothetical protein